LNDFDGFEKFIKKLRIGKIFWFSQIVNTVNVRGLGTVEVSESIYEHEDIHRIKELIRVGGCVGCRDQTAQNVLDTQSDDKLGIELST
jgi:hypothetical protein